MKLPNFALRTRRIIFGCLGWCSVALGMAGVFLPGLPTTVFILAASYLFARSSPRFDMWLQTNRLFGPRLRRYRDYGGGMPRSAKLAALTSMWTAIALSSFALASVSIAAAIVTIALGGIGSFTILFLVRTAPALQPVTSAPAGSPPSPGIGAAVSPQ
jgi:uncharacterized membrane protein YbaN (DUF454 family)